MTDLLKRLVGLSTSKEEDEILLESDDKSDKPYMMASLFYLMTIAVIGLPLWYHTCSTTRHSLPDISELRSRLESTSSELRPRPHLDISVVDLARQNDNDKDDANLRADYLRSELQGFELRLDSNSTYDLSWRIRRPIAGEQEVFRSFFDKGDQATLPELELSLTRVHKPTNKFRLFMYIIEEKYHRFFCEDSEASTYNIGFERFAFLCAKATTADADMSFSHVSTLIKKILIDSYVNSIDKSSLSQTKSGNLDLLVSLIPQSSDKESLADLSDLAHLIQGIFKRNVGESFPDLKELVNIRLIIQDAIDLMDGKDVIGKSILSNETDLKLIGVDAFDSLLHDFESRIGKHSAQDVHNTLVLSNRRSPFKLEFQDTKMRSKLLKLRDSKSLLLVDDDKSLVLGFRTLMRSIIGLTDFNPNCQVRRAVFFNRWEIDALIGLATLNKLHETLNSLSSISQQVVGVKIPKEVAEMSKEASIYATKAIDLLGTKQTLEAYRLASRAFKISDMAYYDPSLIESLYFPDDLKYAIYLPLFLPLAIPMFISLYRILLSAVGPLRRDIK